MQVLRTVPALRDAVTDSARPLGLVPTMGALHDGHLSLVAAARRDCATVVASIFVNPTQFGPEEDLDTYPRDEARDLALLQDHGCDIAFVPAVEEVYPPGDATTLHVGWLSEVLEGESRPGHFDGVATVVARLFGMAQPDRAYFGQKDAQQLVVIRRMAADLAMPVAIEGCPTVRQPDGLALSSRNVHLSPEQREQAAALSAGLRHAEASFEQGLRDPHALRDLVWETVSAMPLADVDYISLADPATLEEIELPFAEPALLSLAVRFGTTRLIDNVLLHP